MPDLPLIFEIENPQEDCFAAIREKIIRYLEKNPHQFNADKIKAREKWFPKEEAGYEISWICDDIPNSTGINIILEGDHISSRYNIPVAIITCSFLLVVLGSTYFNTVITEVNLPGKHPTKTDWTLGWINTLNGVLQSIMSYFAYNTPHYINLISKKIADCFSKREYNLQEDFLIKSTWQRIRSMFVDCPLKTTSITLLSTIIMSATLYGMVMTCIIDYDMNKRFLTQANKEQLTTMNLDSLIKWCLTLYFIEMTFYFFFQFEQFALGIKAALWASEAISNTMTECKKKLSNFANCACFSFAKQKTEEEKKLLVGSISEKNTSSNNLSVSITNS